MSRIIKELRPVLPIKFGRTALDIRLPPEYAPSVYGRAVRMGTIKKEEWLGDGSLRLVMEVPSGMKVDVIEELGNLTKGEVIVKEV